MRTEAFNDTESPPSILIVQQYAVPPTQPGGTRAFEFAKLLSERGWKPRIFAADFSYITRSYFRRTRTRRTVHITEDDIPFIYSWIPTYQKNNRRRLLSMLWFSLATFWQTLSCKEQIFYASSPQIFSAATTRISALIRRKPFVFEVRDLWPESLEAVDPELKNQLMYKVVGSLANWLYRSSALVVIFAEGSRSAVRARGAKPENIAVLDGLDLSAYPTPFHSRSSNEPFKFVYIGSLGAAQGLGAVIKATEILQQTARDPFVVEFVGDGPEADALNRRLDNVIFTGPVPKHNIPEVLQNADAGLLILLPAEIFTFAASPQKLFEYMAAGLPVVSNVQGEMAALLASANAGVSSDGASVEALAAAMKSLLENPRPRETYSGGPSYLTQHAQSA